MMETHPMTAPPPPVPEAARDYLTIALDQDIFALPVANVREVLDPPPMTQVPFAPDHAPGLVNVRGNVMPLLDLRRRFGMEAVADRDTTRLIVTHIDLGGDAFLVGLRADAVYEVVDIDAASIRPAPPGSTRWPAALMQGVVQRQDRYVILLDLNEIVAGHAARAH